MQYNNIPVKLISKSKVFRIHELSINSSEEASSSSSSSNKWGGVSINRSSHKENQIQGDQIRIQTETVTVVVKRTYKEAIAVKIVPS